MNLPLLLDAAVAIVALVLLAVALQRRRRPAASPAREALDTVAAWPPASARVLTIHERQAHDLLKRALPGFMVLAQVPLARFIRVPMRHSYADWMQRVGALSADLLLCDGGSRVLAVVDLRATDESARSKRRHERLARVLQAAGIHVHVWREGALPTLAVVRATIGAQIAAAAAPPPAKPATADVKAMLAAGDHAYKADDGALEPVPSAFFDDAADSVRAPRTLA